MGCTAPYCVANSSFSPKVNYAEASSTRLYNLDWYMDSGATNHVTSDFTNLSIRDKYPNLDQILMGNGKSLPVLDSNTSSLYSSTRSLHLQHILWTPHNSKNLIYISQFSRDNSCFLEFHPHFFVVKDLKMHQEMLQGQLKDGLYFLQSGQPNWPQVLLSTTKSSILWHHRLGHPSFSIVSRAYACLLP